MIPVYLYGEPRGDLTVVITDNSDNTMWDHNGDVVEAVMACGYLTSHFRSIDVEFYDQDIMGRWDEDNDD